MHDYQTYLDSDYWQQIKRQLWQKYKGCQICRRGQGVEVHHLSYENLGQEKLADLVLLCRKCHQRQHFTLFGKKTFLKKKTLRRRYYLLKWSYPLRTFKPSMFLSWFYHLYQIKS